MATELETLVANAACWRCVSARKQLEVQTYIMAVTSGLGTDPETLSTLASGLDGLSFQRLMAILGYILGQFNVAIGGPGDAESIIAANACYRCLSQEVSLSVQTYSLSTDPNGPGTQDPGELLELAKCFCGLSPKRLLMIQIYLLATNAGLSTDPDVLGDAASQEGFTGLPIDVITTEVVTPIIDDVEDGGGGVGPIGPAACEAPQNIPVLINPTYGINDAGQTDVLLSFTLTSECVCSTHQANLYGSNNADGSSATLISSEAYAVSPQIVDIPSPHPDYLYFFMTQTCPSGESGASNILPLIDPAAVAAIVTDYDNRVQANGGAALTGPTVTYLSTFIQDLMAHDLMDLIVALNVFVPDSLTAAITPLIVGPGNDPWTNNNFIAGDLSKYGLKGNGVNKYLQTGVLNNALSATDVSLFGLCDDCLQTGGGADMGSNIGDNAFSVAFFTPSVTGGPYRAHYSSVSLPYAAGNGLLFLSPNKTGFIHATRSALNSAQLYFADPWNDHYLAQNRTDVMIDRRAAMEWYAFAANQAGVPQVGSYSPRRLRTLGIGTHFTQAQSAALYSALADLRASWEDGTLTFGENWAIRVQRNGGVAPAAATITAIDNFLDAVDAAGLMSKMHEINIFAPDNLTACLTLAWRKDSCDIWDNTAFVGADLSVAGLKGDGATKWLGADFFPANSWLSNANAGITMYNTFASNAATFECSAHDTISGGYVTPYISNGGTHYWDCYNQTTTRISVASANYTGYYSANVGADLGGGVTRAICLANSGLPHNAAVTGVAAAAGGLVTSPFGIFTARSNFVLGGAPSPRRLSFFAFHDGLTIAESATFYGLVQALRTELGGGFV